MNANSAGRDTEASQSGFFGYGPRGQPRHFSCPQMTISRLAARLLAPWPRTVEPGLVGSSTNTAGEPPDVRCTLQTGRRQPDKFGPKSAHNQTLAVIEQKARKNKILRR